jgi:type II secretory pathway component PulF
MEFINRFIKKSESAAGDLSAENWATAVIKVACILIIGVVVMQAVVTAANISEGSEFYTLYTSVTQNIESGYGLAALMVLALGCGAVMHFLGFM